MLHSLVNDLLPDLQALSFIDKIGGIVYPFQMKRINSDRNPVVKTIPIYGNNKTVCANEDYIELVPDDRYKSVVYFEAQPEDAVEDSTRMGQVTTTSTITMVGWFNMGKINQNLTSAEGMLRSMLNTVLGTREVGEAHCIIEFNRFRYRDPSIFSGYTYDEAEKQYLIYPFDFGAVELSVQMTYPICDEEPESDPNCFNQ